MGNVHMEATQVNYRGGSKKMSVEEAIKEAGSSYVLPTASAETLGGIKVGNNLTIDPETGALSGQAQYVLPAATDETLGGIKVGSGLSINDGVLSASGGSDVYTNTEEVVGSWMGETLYRKSYYNPSYSSGDVDFSISNIKAVIKIEGMAQIRFVGDDFDSFIPVPYINGNVNADNKFQQGPATQTGKISMSIGNNYTSLLPIKLYMTMYYTKEVTP